MESPNERKDEAASQPIDDKHCLKNIMDALECPICFEPFSSPVFMCATGHDICGNCKQGVDKCPLCKSDVTDRRNYSVEHILNTCNTQTDKKEKKKKYFSRLKTLQVATINELEKLLPHDDTEYTDLKEKYDLTEESLDICRQTLEKKCKELEDLSKDHRDSQIKIGKLEERCTILENKLKESEEKYSNGESQKQEIIQQLLHIKKKAMEILFCEDETGNEVNPRIVLHPEIIQ